MTKTETYDTLIDVCGKEQAKAIANFLEGEKDNLLTKEEFHKHMNEFERNLNTKLWTAFVTVILLIFGLYAAIFIKH